MKDLFFGFGRRSAVAEVGSDDGEAEQHLFRVLAELGRTPRRAWADAVEGDRQADHLGAAARQLCTISDAANCGVSASSPMSLTGAQGTPAFSNASIQCARVLARMASAIMGMSSALFFTRAALLA